MVLQNKPPIKLILRAMVNCLLALIMFGIPLFFPAKSLNFWNAWLFLCVFISSMFFISVFLSISDPKLLEKRMWGKETETTQKIVMTFLILSALSTFAVSGFDFRFHWSRVPLSMTILSTAIMLCGFLMLFVVTLQNSYASRVIEIQEKQELIDTGLYSVVRHPMYMAFAIIFIVSPFMLGSFFALIPALFIPLLIAFRIQNEEKMLEKGLKGYDLYMKTVKYRLIPYVW